LGPGISNIKPFNSNRPDTFPKNGAAEFSTNNLILICALVALVTLAVYAQVGDHLFLNFDDPSYVTENPRVMAGITAGNISWAFTSVDAGNWHPVTWLSHLTDVHCFGMNPRGHHLTNAVIHMLSSLLLLLFLFRNTGSLWQSSFVAVLFALHPLHVESVAWVAERKDVLSAFFWFATLILYSRYVEKRQPLWYLFSFLCFVMGLMSKPMLVTLPLIMLLMDYWPFVRYPQGEPGEEVPGIRGRALALATEKLPFFACSLLSGIITIYAQHKGGAISSLETVPFTLRIENALVAYVRYLIKTVWPSDLAVLYPFSSSLPLWQVTGSLLALILVTVATLRLRYRHPFLTVGWFWFLVTLVPVIGLIQVGSQSMADRYSYLPVTGLFIMAAWGVPVLVGELRYRRPLLFLLAGAAVMACAALTWQQLGYWRDNISLYQHTLKVTSGSYLVHSNLGAAFAEKGNLEEAIHHYRAAIRINPGKFDAHGNLGLALMETGDLDAAVQECRVALRLSPNNPNSHYNLGAALARKGDLNTAIREFRAALLASPDNPAMHTGLGVALAGKGDLDAAIQEFQTVIRINPNDEYAIRSLERARSRKNGR
jgi:protein O-mannosyl-transferase